MTQEKTQQYIGIKYGEDIVNKIENKVLVVLSPPKYSDAIELRHIECEYYNQTKTHSLQESNLEKHYGQVYSLIYGQCTHLLQDKLKQEKSLVAVSASYKPLEMQAH